MAGARIEKVAHRVRSQPHAFPRSSKVDSSYWVAWLGSRSWRLPLRHAAVRIPGVDPGMVEFLFVDVPEKPGDQGNRRLQRKKTEHPHHEHSRQ